MNNRHAARLTLAGLIVCLFASLAAGAPMRKAATARSTQNSSQTFNLADFGAVGNGQTDDGPALQAALEAVVAAGGGTLFVPAGRYAIVTPVAVPAPSGIDLVIRGVESMTPVPPPTADGDHLTRGLNLVSEFLPRTGPAAAALSVGTLRSLLIQDIAFVGTPDADTDALITLSIAYTPDAVIRHCEFYGLMSLEPGGAVVQNYGGGLTIQQSEFLGCTANSGVYAPVVQNLLWESITVEDTIFADYGQRPDFYAKTGVGSPLSWVNVGHASPPTADSPRREVVLRNVFLDEGGWQAVTLLPARYQNPTVPIDLFYAAGLYVNVSNFNTTGIYASGAQEVLIEDSIFTWSSRADSAIHLFDAQDAILDRIQTSAAATRLTAEDSTSRLTVIDSIYTDLNSAAAQTIVLNPATPDEDPVRYVRARFETQLGREPDSAAHYYWSRKLLDCGASAPCVALERAALDDYLAATPAPTFAVTGRATDENGQPLAGASVTLTGAQSATTTTGADGTYAFRRLPTSGSYTFTVSKRHYTFAQPTRTVFLPAGAQVIDFDATLNRHAIGGRLLDERGRAIQGATLTLSGAQNDTATSDANGDYSFNALAAGGDYTVTVSSTRYSFANPAQTFTDLDADSAADFGGLSLFYSITGQIVDNANKPAAGFSVALSGGKTATATTDVQGNFAFTDLPRGGNYTVTPAKLIGTLFTPVSKVFDNLTDDQTAVFVAVPTNFKLAGRVTSGGTGLAGVTMTLDGSKLATTTTDSGGNYSFNVPVHGNFTVAPSKTHYTFDRASSTFNGVTADKTADFVATINRHKLSGSVKQPAGAAMPGVTVTLSGGQTATTTTDAQGGYSFANLPAGSSYTVTPSKTGYDFAPASKSLTDLGADQTIDFSATPSNLTLAGRVTADGSALAGASVTLSGSKTETATTDANGNYSFTVTSEGSYTVTPSKTHYTFAPSTLSFNKPTSAQTADFTGTLTQDTLSGRVTEKGAPLAGVTIDLTGAQTGKATTGADGTYSFTVTPGGDYTVKPSKRNYTFDRDAATFKAVASNQTADFNAKLQTVLSFAATTYNVGEGGGSVTITVTREGDTSTEASAVYEGHGDTAKLGSDFVASIGLLTFAPGETTKTFTLFITDDAFAEGPERFTLTLAPFGDAVTGDASVASVTINDNDATTAATNPIDEDEFFVRQHYRDFFSREPDAPGLKFWTDELKRCGTDAPCREARRISVSAAFFLSIEFKETGYLVYRLYRASFGREPARVGEFMLDSRMVGDGIVVGADGWAEKLAANKKAFLAEWTQRPEFVERFKDFNDYWFVQTLFVNMNVTLTDARREALLAKLSAGTTRAQVLAEVIDDEQFNKQEVNRAFVLMQYFGYLRRNPNDPPDSDLTGYNNWLGKLNDFGGDYEKAELVKAFLSSIEYRSRFGN